MKKTARLGDESSAFDARVLFGLDRLGLVPVWQRHERKGSRAGVWLIGCGPEDDAARHCAECGAAGRVRSSWRRRFVHTPVGQKAFASRLAERPQSFRDHVKVIAMDAFAGYKKAARHEVPHAVEVLAPFHIVELAGDSPLPCDAGSNARGPAGAAPRTTRCAKAGASC